MKRIGFVGATTSTLRNMQRLIKEGHAIAVLYTLQGPALYSKNRSIDLSGFCKEHHIPLVSINEGQHIKDPHYTEDIKTRNLDLLVESGFSQILPHDFLSAPAYGTVGLHYSPLPAYKGPASLNWALLLDKKEWGISLFTLTAGIDEGGIIGQQFFPVTDADNVNTLFDKADSAAADLLAQYVPAITAGKKHHINPPGEHSQTRRFAPEEYQINWRNSARQNFNLVRAFTHPFPGVYTVLDEGALFYWRARVAQKTHEEPGTVLAADTHRLVVACGDGHALEIDSASLIDTDLISERHEAKKVIGNRLQHEQQTIVSPAEYVRVGQVLPSSQAKYPSIDSSGPVNLNPRMGHQG